MAGLGRIVARLRVLEERLVTGMAYFCGALFLLLGVYTALEVFGRRYLGVFSGVSDEMGGYALALGGSWAFAYTLRAGGHVRVDVLLPHLPARVQAVLDAAAMMIMAVFAATVALALWKLVGASYAIQATGHSIINTPQWIPQAMMASGYTMLALVAVTSLLAQLLSARPPDSPAKE